MSAGPGERVLLTGATGFIGGHLAQRLVGEGREVRCLVRASSDTTLLDGLGVELAVGDLTDAPSLARAVAGCGAVVHCGALVSDWALPEEIAAINVAGTRDLAAAAVRASVRRFVHVSSTDVYGYPGGAPVPETFAPTRFANWYSQTKRDAEAEVRNTPGLDGVILRPATVYGPRSTEVVGEIARAVARGQMVLVGGGRAVAGLCYVGNLADAVALALDHERAPGEAFNVSDGLEVTWREFVGDLAAGLDAPPPRWSLPYPLASALGVALEHGYRVLRRTTKLTTPALLSRQAVQVLGRDQRFSNRKARELLGWEPRVGYRDGFAATLAWLRAEGIGS